jgi:DNA-binding response OmpR family regulator
MRSSQHILLIEDDQNLGFFLKRFLEMKNYAVTYCWTGGLGLDTALKNRYEMIILDIGLPEVDGLSIVKQLRKQQNDKPIIIITDKIEVETEINSFKLGASLFHRKPINYELLELQIISNIGKAKKEEILSIDRWEVNATRKLLKVSEHVIRLSHNELKLLELLIKSNCKIFTRDEIIRKIFNNKNDVELGAVDTLVSRLRKKLLKYEQEELIETVFKTGYRLHLKYLAR